MRNMRTESNEDTHNTHLRSSLAFQPKHDEVSKHRMGACGFAAYPLLPPYLNLAASLGRTAVSPLVRLLDASPCPERMRLLRLHH